MESFLFDCRHRIRIRRHPNARALRLRIDPVHGIPVLTVPMGCPEARIGIFLLESEKWLEERIKLYTQTNHKIPDALAMGGVAYGIIHEAPEARSRAYVCTETRKIVIMGPRELSRLALLRLLKVESLKVAKEFTSVYADALGVVLKKIDVREYRSRWGCCYPRGDIFVSWRLILAPLHVFSYVCAHEVAHMVYNNHSHYFWKTVSQIFPGYRESRKWLKEYGQTLFQLV